MYSSNSSSANTSSVISFAPNNTICGFEGNNDIYGIGIRIGTYAQILAVWFANYFLLSEAQVLRDAITIFGLAILIVSLIRAADPSEVYAVEAFVLLQILTWSCMMGVRAKSSYNWGTFSRRCLMRKVVCDFIYLINICLQVWFWWTGLDKMKETPCGTWLMMYVVKTSMFGWARKVMMALSLFMLVVTVYWVILEFSRQWSIWKMRKARKDFSQAIEAWNEMRRLEDEAKQELDQEEEVGHIAWNKGSLVQDSHDGCSKFSCSRCSPVESDFDMDRDPRLDRSHSEPLPFEGRQSKRCSRITIEELASQSPPSSQTSSHTQIASAELDAKSTIIQEVYECELFIQHCLSASPYQRSLAEKSLTLPVMARSILFPKKYRTTEEGTPNPPSWFRCQLYTWKALILLRFPLQALVVYSHLRQSRLLDPLNGPFQTYAAMTYTSSLTTEKKVLPSWSSVSLASSLLLTVPETPKKIWLGWYYALLDLLVNIIVILQLELTLHWNHISGLVTLSASVGQLIPFIIGVGGLGLVVSRWVIKAWAKWRMAMKAKNQKCGWQEDAAFDIGKVDNEGACETFRMRDSVREGYERWKKAYAAAKTTTEIRAIVPE